MHSVTVTCLLFAIGKACIAKGRRLGRDWANIYNIIYMFAGKMSRSDQVRSAIGPAVVAIGARKAGDWRVFRKAILENPHIYSPVSGVSRKSVYLGLPNHGNLTQNPETTTFLGSQ